MIRNGYTNEINELSASEHVFTTAQAARFGIPRNVLSNACDSGRLIRVLHGAYRIAGVPSAETDVLEALWKLTDPAAFTHERMRRSGWDGIAVGGSTAAAIHGMGDFYLTPYRILAPRRLRSRSGAASFAVRRVNRSDVSFAAGFPVTSPERTIVDLLLDREDPSLVLDAANDARRLGIDEARLGSLLEAHRVDAALLDTIPGGGVQAL